MGYMAPNDEFSELMESDSLEKEIHIMDIRDVHAESSSGKVVAVCLSEERGTVKQNVGAGYLKEGYGLLDDAHAGSDKQVSLLALEDVQKVCAAEGIEASPGDFAENITTSGIDLVSLPVGIRLQLGEAVIKVTRIGKEKHLVHTYNYKGVSILPQRGVFANVEKSGNVKTGDKIVAIA